MTLAAVVPIAAWLFRVGKIICGIVPVEINKASSARQAPYTAAKLLCLSVLKVSFLVSAVN